MKNYLLPLVSVLLFAGCHLKKKTSEINTVDKQTILQTTKGVKTQTDSKIIRIDSSKITRSSIEDLNHSKSIEIEFELISEKSIPGKNNSAFFEQLLNKSQKVKIRINHTQQKINSQLLIQQNNIKSKIDSSTSKEESYKQALKINIKEKSKVTSESKINGSLMWWVIAVGILAITYFLNKFNINGFILRLFKNS